MSVGARKRELGTLTRADLGKRISFTCECDNNPRRVIGTLRSFSQGLYDHDSRGEVDVPLTCITVRTARSHEGHWASPEAIATVTA